VTDRCASCHGTNDLQAAALYDTSGGAHLQLCLLCLEGGEVVPA